MNKLKDLHKWEQGKSNKAVEFLDKIAQNPPRKLFKGKGRTNTLHAFGS